MQSRTIPGPATLAHHNAVIGRLRKAGFTIHRAAHAFSVIDGHLYGFVWQQTNLPYRTLEESAQLAEDIFRQFHANDYPYFAERITEHAKRPGYNYADESEFGLDLILDALERLRGVA